MDSFPETLGSLQQDIDANIYYKTLCSSGLSFVNKQHSQIEQKKNNLIENKQKLVYNNYDSFLKFSDFSKDLINDFQDIEHSLENLKRTIPDFKNKCQIFSNDAQKISLRWKNVSLMLSKYPQLIEFLEIPQLLNNCIRTFYYEDALKICDFIIKFCAKNTHMAPIFQNMLIEIDKNKDVMIAQILKEMNGNIQLPTCIKLIDYLRQSGRFSEDQLKVNFLTARDVWFQSSLNKNMPKIHSLNHISSITEVFRINIFDIVTQYRAIFPELDSKTIISTKNTIQEKNYNEIDENSKIINSWLVLKIEEYLKILQEILESCLENSFSLSLDTAIEHCFYFGLSMSKIGADIRPLLINIFNTFIKKRFKYCVDLANKRFQSSINDIFKNVGNSNSSQETIEEFAIIMTYYNDLLSLFNEIRKNAPLSLTSYFVATLNESFMHIAKALNDYISEHKFSLNSTEFQVFLRFCNTLRNHLFPLLNKNFQQLCPVSAISKQFGISVLEMSKVGSFKLFELDIKSPNEQINIIMNEISDKL